MSKVQLAAVRARLDALEHKTFGHIRRRLTKRQLAELEGCSTREVDRRRARGVYRAPEVENKRVYWWSDTYRLSADTVAADTATARAERNPRLRKPAHASPEA